MIVIYTHNIIYKNHQIQLSNFPQGHHSFQCQNDGKLESWILGFLFFWFAPLGLAFLLVMRGISEKSKYAKLLQVRRRAVAGRNVLLWDEWDRWDGGG